jgi:hypothetical protein
MEEDSGGEDDGAGHAALEAAEAEKRAKEDKTPAFEVAPLLPLPTVAPTHVPTVHSVC